MRFIKAALFTDAWLLWTSAFYTHVRGINKPFLTVICLSARAAEIIEEHTPKQGDFRFSNCRIVADQPCPYPDIKFYLYTRRRPEYPQPIAIGNTIDNSNITKSDFDYRLPTKIIIHGYNSDMFLGALVEIKQRMYYLPFRFHC